MSVIPFRRGPAAEPVVPLDPYFASEPRPAQLRDLRPLSAVEQMYAYWGWDLAPQGTRT